MSRPVSHFTVIAAMVAKDLRTFMRDRMWIVLTPFSLVFVALAFWLSPATVDDSLWLGIHPPESVELLEAIAGDDDDDVRFVPFDDEERLVAAITGDLDGATEREDNVSMGLAFPPDFRDAIQDGRQTEVTLHVDPAVPPELRHALAAEVREVAFAAQAHYVGQSPSEVFPVRLTDESDMTLGEDRAGSHVPMRDKLRPMLAILILLLSSIAIAGLVALEIEHRTVTALLVTPASTGDLLAAKGITGAILGVSQVLIFMVLTMSFGDHFWLIGILLFLGALMMAAVGMIAGSAGRDFMSTMFLSVAAIIPMGIPTFTILFPGSDSLWVQAMPSYGFVEAMVGVMGYGRGPGEVVVYVAHMAVWTVALLGLALWLLKRRVEAL